MVYRLKTVRYQGRECPILLQNENGPCPLLAAANALLLLGRCHLPSSSVRNEVASLEDVSNMLAEHAMCAISSSPSSQEGGGGSNNNNKKKSSSGFGGTFAMLTGAASPTSKDTSTINKGKQQDFHQHGNINKNGLNNNNNHQHNDDVTTIHHINELVNNIPKFQYGMDINIKFDAGITGYEYTSQLTAFDMMKVKLVHGWLVNPFEDNEYNVFEALQGNTYNQIVERIIAGKEASIELEHIQQRKIAMSSGCHMSSPPNDDDPIEQQRIQRLMDTASTGVLLDNFVTATSHQLTQVGLQALHDGLQNNEMCVLFRNNHFGTLTKHSDGHLYVLVTDLGYANSPAIIWERLDVIDGDTEYFNNQFLPSSNGTTKQIMMGGGGGGGSSLTPEQLMATSHQRDADYDLAIHLSSIESQQQQQQQSLSSTSATIATLPQQQQQQQLLGRRNGTTTPRSSTGSVTSSTTTTTTSTTTNTSSAAAAVAASVPSSSASDREEQIVEAVKRASLRDIEEERTKQQQDHNHLFSDAVIVQQSDSGMGKTTAHASLLSTSSSSVSKTQQQQPEMPQTSSIRSSTSSTSMSSSTPPRQQQQQQHQPLPPQLASHDVAVGVPVVAPTGLMTMPPPPITTPTQEDADRLLAMQLQEDVNAAEAQSRANNIVSVGGGVDQYHDASLRLAMQLQEEEDRRAATTVSAGNNSIIMNGNNNNNNNHNARNNNNNNNSSNNSVVNVGGAVRTGIANAFAAATSAAAAGRTTMTTTTNGGSGSGSGGFGSGFGNRLRPGGGGGGGGGGSSSSSSVSSSIRQQQQYHRRSSPISSSSSQHQQHIHTSSSSASSSDGTNSNCTIQ